MILVKVIPTLIASYVFSVVISPICQKDLVGLPPSVAGGLRNLGPLVISHIALLDTFTLRHCVLNADQYWRSPFESVLTTMKLVEYVILDVEIVSSEVPILGSRYALADAQVAGVSDFGKNNTIFSIRTHLGHLLKPGDYAFGYGLVDIQLDTYQGLVQPDLVLVKKSYKEKTSKIRR